MVKKMKFVTKMKSEKIRIIENTIRNIRNAGSMTISRSKEVLSRVAKDPDAQALFLSILLIGSWAGLIYLEEKGKNNKDINKANENTVLEIQEDNAQKQNTNKKGIDIFSVNGNILEKDR